VPYLDLDDIEGMEREARSAAELGFTGKGSIHPKQIAPLNAIFSPDEAAIAHARRVIAAFEEADSGLVVLDNKLIEKPVLRTMHRTVHIAERIAAAE
jgi:citrate lyase beta subunit